MKLTVIGSGNAFHLDGRGHSSYLLETRDHSPVLMDAGVSALMNLRRFQIPVEDIETILLTHFHGDHIAGIPFIMLTLGFLWKTQPNRELRIIGPVGISDRVENLLNLFYENHDFSLKYTYKEIQPDETLSIPGFQIRAMNITHNPESLGYRIKDDDGKILVYGGDSAMDDRLVTLLENADLGIMELSMTENPSGIPHVSLEELRRYNDRITAKQLLFSHTYDELVKKLEKESGLTLPYSTASDGMIIHL